MRKKIVDLLTVVRNKISGLFSKKPRFVQLSKEILSSENKTQTFGHLEIPAGLKSRFKDISNFAKRFDYEHTFKTLFSVHLRPYINSVFLITICACLSYSAGKLAALFLHPAPVLKTPSFTAGMTQEFSSTKGDLQVISQANLFKIKQNQDSTETCDPNLMNCPDQRPQTPTGPAICLEASNKSSLPLKLLNTVVLQDSVKSIASVQVRSASKTEILREGDKIQALANIGKIAQDKVIIKNLSSQQCEYLEVARSRRSSRTAAPPIIGPSKLQSRPNPNIKQEGDKFTIEKTYVKTQLENITNILTEARAVQMTNPDGSLCFKMTEIKPGSVYTQLDILENDIVCEINGKKITNLNELMRLFGQLQTLSMDHFELGLRRNGVEKNLEYHLR